MILLFRYEAISRSLPADRSPARRPCQHCAMHVFCAQVNVQRSVSDCACQSDPRSCLQLYLVVVCCAMPPHHFVMKKILKRSEPAYKQPTARCWMGSWVNPSVAELTAVLSFNEPGGLVPIAHALAYIIIAGEGLGDYFANPDRQATMYFYFELRNTTVTDEQLRRWFPRCRFEWNQCTSEETKERLRNMGTFIERTFADPTENLARLATPCRPAGGQCRKRHQQ